MSRPAVVTRLSTLDNNAPNLLARWRGFCTFPAAMAIQYVCRRDILALFGSGAALFGCGGTTPQPGAIAPSATEGGKKEHGQSTVVDTISIPITDLEKRVGGRLGVCVLDAVTGEHVGHRLEERFAMCSSFKLALAGLILREVDRGVLRLDQPVAFSKADLVHHAPVTEKRLAEGQMTVSELAEAAQTTSDNVAANLLLRLLGGPTGFTKALVSLGDTSTRLDRWEPDMNFVLPGDPRDTTMPLAMARTAARFVVGDELKVASRNLLIEWMIATKTGAKRIRAGLPEGLRAGDKTGTGIAKGMTTKYNDVAVVWPAGQNAHVISVYFDTAVETEDMRDEDLAVLAEVGRLAMKWILSRR